MPKSALLVLALLVAGMSPARAELPPGSYDALRRDAEEALIIEVEAVHTKEVRAGMTNVMVEARVVAVERSRAGLKKHGKLTIRYESVDRAKLATPMAGPRTLPVLRKGESYPAFLKDMGKGEFEPAAYGESFAMTPEG